MREISRKVAKKLRNKLTRVVEKKDVRNIFRKLCFCPEAVHELCGIQFPVRDCSGRCPR